MKAVIKLENGTVQNVYVDDTAVKVLVLDSDTDGCDNSSRLRTGNAVYGLDAMAQAIPKVNKELVDDYFDKVQVALTKRPREKFEAKVLKGLFDSGLPATDTLSAEQKYLIREVFSAIGVPRLDIEYDGADDSEPCYVLSSEGGTCYGFLHYSQTSAMWYFNKIETITESKRGDPCSVEVNIGRGTDPVTASVEAAQHWASYLIQYALARAVPDQAAA